MEIRLHLSRIRGFQVLGHSTGSQRAKALTALAVAVGFAFVSQIIGAFIYALSPVHTVALGTFLYGEVFAHGELPIYTVALLAPGWIVIVRDSALAERGWLVLYAAIATGGSILVIELIQIGYQLSATIYAAASVLFLLLALLLVYILVTIDQIDPQEIGREIEIEKDRELEELTLELAEDVDAG